MIGNANDNKLNINVLTYVYIRTHIHLCSHDYNVDYNLVLKGIVENYLEIFLKNGIIKLDDDAKKMLSDIKNDKSNGWKSFNMRFRYS